MTKMSSIERSKVETDELTSEQLLTKRRRMLKAAAAAPFIATIHSGAARANASASQCVIDSKEASDGADVPLQTQAPETPDEWVRRKGQFADGTSNVYYTEDNSLPTDFKIYKADTDTKWYTEWGQPVDIEIVFNSDNVTPTCDPATQICVKAENSTPTLLLEIYRPEIVNSVPVSVHPVGYYARDDLRYYRESAPEDNMAITASCLVSVDPGLDPNAGA